MLSIPEVRHRRVIRAALSLLPAILLTTGSLEGQQPRPTISIPESAQIVIGRTTKMPAIRVSAEGLPASAKISVNFDVLTGPAGGLFATGKREAQAEGAPGGEVAVPRLANVAGRYEIRVRALVPGLTETATATFELVSSVGPRQLRIEPVVRSDAEYKVCQPAPAPEVRIVDENGRAVYGAEVVFRLPASPQGGTFTGGTNTARSSTDENGRAAGSVFHADKKGQLTISVSATLTPNVAAQTGIQQSIQGCGSRWRYYILAIAGGGTAAGLAVARGGGGSTPPPSPATVLQPGKTTIGAP